MSLISKLSKLWVSTELSGKTFVSRIQIVMGTNNLTNQQREALHLEFRRNFILIRNLRTKQTKQLMWEFLDKDNDKYTFRDEKYGQWLISEHHITYTDMESGDTTSFMGKIL